MHLFTLTICTNLFIEHYEDKLLEKCSYEIFNTFYRLINNYKKEVFDYELYWRRGCLIVDIIVKSKDEKLQTEFVEIEKDFKKSKEYKQLLKYVEEKLSEFPEDILVEKVRFEIKRFKISRNDFISRGIRMRLDNLI
jgi:hypothetical protein